MYGRIKDSKFPLGIELEKMEQKGKRTVYFVYLYEKKIGFVIMRGAKWVTSDLSLDLYPTRVKAVTALYEEEENV